MTRIVTTSARNAVCLLAFAALFLALAAPAAAEPASQQDCGPSLAFLGAESPEALLFGPARPAPQARKKDDSIGDPGELATCIADCGSGSTVTCYGTSCTADDRNCPSQRGQCWGTTTGTRYCPGTCGCTAECEDGSTVTCYGSSCSATDWSCPSERGHCYGSTTGTKYCPELETCSTCNDPTPCEEKNGTSCSGSGPYDCALDPPFCGSCFCDSGTWSCTV